MEKMKDRNKIQIKTIKNPFQGKGPGLKRSRENDYDRGGLNFARPEENCNRGQEEISTIITITSHFLL
jgi:hypothetical protein